MTKTFTLGIVISVIVVVLYVGSFAFLLNHEFSDWTYSPFVESVIAVFHGAGAIAIITAIILIFQSSLDSRRERNQLVFENKIELYTKAIDVAQDLFNAQEFNVETLQNLELIILRLQLISTDQSIDKYMIFHQKVIATEEFNQENILEIKTLFSAFLGQCRVEIGLASKEIPDEMFQMIQRSIADADKKKYQKTDFGTWDNFRQSVLKSNHNLVLIEATHRWICDQFNLNDKHIRYSQSMISYYNDAGRKGGRFVSLRAFSSPYLKLKDGTKINIKSVDDLSEKLKQQLS